MSNWKRVNYKLTDLRSLNNEVFISENTEEII